MFISLFKHNKLANELNSAQHRVTEQEHIIKRLEENVKELEGNYAGLERRNSALSHELKKLGFKYSSCFRVLTKLMETTTLTNDKTPSPSTRIDECTLKGEAHKSSTVKDNKCFDPSSLGELHLNGERALNENNTLGAVVLASAITSSISSSEPSIDSLGCTTEQSYAAPEPITEPSCSGFDLSPSSDF